MHEAPADSQSVRPDDVGKPQDARTTSVLHAAGDTAPATVVIGAGPAGLTAAYVLVNARRRVLVLERDREVGGIARTVEYKGFRFDIGGHRFFTKVQPVRDLWHRMLGADMLRRPRLSRIFYAGAFFDYPLRTVNALSGLGIVNAIRVLVSYLWRQLRPVHPEISFEDWVCNRFGTRLYEIFFKTYTEKVWGIPCSTIGAQWAAQRIKGLSLKTAILDMMLRPFRRPGQARIKTLIDEFEYPRLGPGMMWDAFRNDVTRRGGSVRLSTEVMRLNHRDRRVCSVEYRTAGGGTETVDTEGVISTMPLRQLVASFSPPAPDWAREAADRLNYRDFLTVALIVDAPDLFPDNWIYVHDPDVRLGRIQNFKNWSPDLVPDPQKTCLGLEYFCFEGDGLWSMADEDLIALGRRELAHIGLARPEQVVDGTVVRMPKAYPVYDQTYEEALATVRRYLETFTNVQVAGRNGMHKYNNQDHSMVTGMLAARHLLGHPSDAWAVNADDEYHEQGVIDLGTDLRDLLGTQPAVPVPLHPPGDHADTLPALADERLVG